KDGEQLRVLSDFFAEALPRFIVGHALQLAYGLNNVEPTLEPEAARLLQITDVMARGDLTIAGIAAWLAGEGVWGAEPMELAVLERALAAYNGYRPATMVRGGEVLYIPN